MKNQVTLGKPRLNLVKPSIPMTNPVKLGKPMTNPVKLGKPITNPVKLGKPVYTNEKKENYVNLWKIQVSSWNKPVQLGTPMKTQ